MSLRLCDSGVCDIVQWYVCYLKGGVVFFFNILTFIKISHEPAVEKKTLFELNWITVRLQGSRTRRIKVVRSRFLSKKTSRDQFDRETVTSSRRKTGNGEAAVTSAVTEACYCLWDVEPAEVFRRQWLQLRFDRATTIHRPTLRPGCCTAA